MKSNKQLSIQRRNRVRSGLRKRAKDRLRLSVFRSGRHIYAQIIDDEKGATLAAASSLDKDMKSNTQNGKGIEVAGTVGKLIAARAKDVGISKVVFDRGAYLYHGRVKALAEAARESTITERTIKGKRTP